MKFSLGSLFLFLVMLSCVYQDFPAINSYGEIARSPIVFLTPLMLLSLIFLQKLKFSFYSKCFLIYIYYLVFISIVFIGFFYIRVGAFSIFDENVILKTVKMLMYSIISFVLYLYLYNYLRSNNQNIFILAKQIYIIQLLLFAVLIIESSQNADGITVLQWLHSSEEKYWRIRLLTLEASWSGPVVVVFSLLPIYFASNDFLKKNKKFIYFTSISFLLFYTILSGSKGYLLLFVFALLPNVFQILIRSKYRNYLFFGIFLAIVIFGIYAESFFFTVFGKLYTSQSFGTRFASYLSALRTFVLHSFGVGLGPYMYYYTESIRSIIESGWLNIFNLDEISVYINTTKALSTKTYFFDQLIYGGVGFLWFFYNFFLTRFKKLLGHTNNILKVILLFLVLAGITFVTFHVKYEIWLFLAIIDYIEVHNKENQKHINEY